MTTFYKKILPTFLVIALAVLTGLVIGKMYLSANTALADSKLSWAEAHTPMNEVEALYNSSKEKNIKEFSAKELYLIAEYKLSLSDFTITTTGTIESGVSLGGKVVGKESPVMMRSVKQKAGNLYTYEKLSPTRSVAGIPTPNICMQMTYDLQKKNEVKIVKSDSGAYFTNKGSYSSIDPSVLRADFDGASVKDTTRMRVADYEKQFKATPDKQYVPFIISNVTYKAKPEVTHQDGLHSFTIRLDGHDVLKDAALYYAKEICYTCGYGNPSINWSNVTINVVIDDNFNFKTIEYDENYKLFASGLPMGVQSAEVEDKFVSVFNISEVA